MSDVQQNKQNAAAAQNAHALEEESAKDTKSQGVEGASQLAEKARQVRDRVVEEGRRRLPEAEEYYREGREVVRAQVQESPMLAIVVAGAIGYFLAYLIHGGNGRTRGSRSDAPPFGRRPPINEAQRHGLQQDPRERAEGSRDRT